VRTLPTTQHSHSCDYETRVSCAHRFAPPAGDPEEEGAPEPLQAALSNKEAYQHVRALPCAARGAVVFTHRLIHWGSAASRQPRVAVSFVFADPAFEVCNSNMCGTASASGRSKGARFVSAKQAIKNMIKAGQCAN
jgi:hypothetical protein